MKKSQFLHLLVAFGLLAFVTGALHAQDLGTVRERMAERLPQIDALKAQGSLGENNRGLLEVRSPSDEATAVSRDENRDREVVYATIAKQTGSTPAAVGTARARQIATNSARGVWLQRENGEWYRK